VAGGGTLKKKTNPQRSRKGGEIWNPQEFSKSHWTSGEKKKRGGWKKGLIFNNKKKLEKERYPGVPIGVEKLEAMGARKRSGEGLTGKNGLYMGAPMKKKTGTPGSMGGKPICFDPG